MRGEFAAWLREEGHEARIELGDSPRFATVSFRTRGRTYKLRVDEQDRSFCHLHIDFMLPAWLEDEMIAMRAAAAVQSEIKAVKVGTDFGRRTAGFDVEQFLFAAGRLDNVLWRCVGAAVNAADRFFALLGESQPPASERFIADLERELTPHHGEDAR